MIVVVRGVGDIGSAVAHRLFQAGFGVVVHDEPKPTTTRRGMAFADAIFDGEACLDGVCARRADYLRDVRRALEERAAIPVHVREWEPLLAALGRRAVVDARMRKHSAPEILIGCGDLTVGLGPALVAGRHAHVLVETSWDGLGTVIADGATRPLTGEPRTIGGHARDRYVYAPVEGTFRTDARIGGSVRQGQDIAEIEGTVLRAPLDGVLRGLTHDDVPVAVRTKVIEVDPRGRVAEAYGISERPRRIAEGVLTAIRAYEAASRRAE